MGQFEEKRTRIRRRAQQAPWDLSRGLAHVLATVAEPRSDDVSYKAAFDAYVDAHRQNLIREIDEVLAAVDESDGPYGLGSQVESVLHRAAQRLLQAAQEQGFDDVTERLSRLMDEHSTNLPDRTFDIDAAKLPFLSEGTLRTLFSVSSGSSAAQTVHSSGLVSVLANLLYHDDTALRLLLPGLANSAKRPIASCRMSVRARNALNRASITTWGELGERSIQDLRELRNVGSSTVEDILERAIEVSLFQLDDEEVVTYKEIPASRHDVIELAQETTTCAARELIRVLAVLAEWGSTIRAAKHFNELITLAVEPSSLPPDVKEAWDSLAALNTSSVLDSSPANEPIESAMNDLLGYFDPARLAVLERRILGEPPQTLQELADSFGLSRERVRQLQAGIEDQLSSLLVESRFRPLTWRAHQLRQALGPAAPADAVATTSAIDLAVRGTQSSSGLPRKLVLHIAGPYRLRDGWLIRKDARLPGADEIARSADEYGLLSADNVRNSLTAAGLLPMFQDAWIDSLEKIRRIDDSLVVWPRNAVDKCVAVLAHRDEPTDTETLVQLIGDSYSVRGIRARLFGDIRVMRVNRTDWALRSWNLEEYTGITDEIAQRIDEAGGRVLLNNVIDELVSTFGVKENSVRAYAEAPMFIVDGDWIRLRSEDEPFEIDDDLAGCRGVFAPASGRLSVLLSVDQELLRGSGRPIPSAVAAALGVTPGHPRRFACTAAPVSVTWPVSAGLGPSLGSVRQIAEAADAHDGELLRLDFATETGHLTFERVPADLSGLTEREALHLLAGISPDGSPAARVAAAIGVPETDLRRVLLSRGDVKVVELLPRPTVDSDLDEALGQFANLLGEVP